MGPISFDVVTPLGEFITEEGLDELVVRRRESRFDPGSEVAVFPRHGPMLVRLQKCIVRYVRGRKAYTLEVDGGFAEVLDDHVTMIVPSARRVPGGE